MYEPAETGSREEKWSVFAPWDLMRGFDVFRDSVLLHNTLSEVVFQHWAPNCGTFSRARERPIPGVANPPVPLRSDECPFGIPSVLSTLPPAKRRKVELDTDMAVMAADSSLRAHRNGRYFGLEHPKNSIARRLPGWETLEQEVGVFVSEYHACMFEGSRRRKAQILIHNVPILRDFIALLCPSDHKCRRTGSRHLAWKPRVANGKVTSFATSAEREYPQGFCEAYAQGLKKHFENRPMSFVEIFSGANAPLSAAVAKVGRTTVPNPRGRFADHKGNVVELSDTPLDMQELPRSSGSKLSVLDKSMGGEIALSPEGPSTYRQSAVQAGSQPSYGKRTQLIADGLNDPQRHLAKAKSLEHPFDSISALKPDHAKALAKLSGDQQQLINLRFSHLDMIRKWKHELTNSQVKANRSAAWTAQKLGTKISTRVMDRLQEFLKIEDTAVPNICLQGLNITGRASTSPFFEDFEVPPTMSKMEFIRSSRQRSLKMIDRVKFMAEKGDPDLAKAIWDKTQKEVQNGTMGPPMSLYQIERLFGEDFQVTPSFGLSQGRDESGNRKFRRIDDHTASGVNPAAHRLQKVPMAMADYVGVLLRSVAQQHSSIQMATEDMKGAYRQVPLSPSDVRYAVTAVYDPTAQEVKLHLMYGQPFGAGHSVPNFCRVSEWIARALQRLFFMAVDHFFDDFFIIEPSFTISSAVFCLQETFKVLGFQLDPDKSQQPSECCAILGILFSTSVLRTERKLILKAKPSRVQNLKEMIKTVKARQDLSPALAASIVGKFGFLCSTLFGKVGRCCTAPLRHRQYSPSLATALTPVLSNAMDLMIKFLESCPPRELHLFHSQPVILYTDASEVPGRTPERLLGAVLYDPLDQALLYSCCPVPQTTVDKWLPKKTHMGQLELLAAPFAFATWEHRLQKRPVLLWIDNDSAASSLVKGYSPQLDSAPIVGDFWLMISQLQSSVYIDRVESKSNLADGPSRNSFELLRILRANWTPPKTGTLGDLHFTPPAWNGAPTAGGEE